jgi:hypothetical protein
VAIIPLSTGRGLRPLLPKSSGISLGPCTDSSTEFFNVNLKVSRTISLFI